MAYHTFEGYIHVSTSGALLFQSHYWEAPLWVPKSQSYVETDPDSMEVVVKIKDWLCRKKKLMEFTFYPESEIQLMNG